MNHKRTFFLLSLVVFATLSFNMTASDVRITSSAQITEWMFGMYPDTAFLVKRSKDMKFIGFLFNKNHVQVYNIYTQQKMFDSHEKFPRNTVEIVNFKLINDVVVLCYKAIWKNEKAYDLYTGKFVPRYSSWIEF